MKYGKCKTCQSVTMCNARELCASCARERHKAVAESKGFVIKTKNERKTIIRDIFKGDREPQGAEQVQKQISPKKTKVPIRHRSKKGLEIVKAELLLFQKIFKERPPFCEWCGVVIEVFNPCNYHHVKTKGSHPELRLVESNVVKVCVECHMKEHGFNPRK